MCKNPTCLDCQKEELTDFEQGIKLTKERIVRQLNNDAVIQLNVPVNILEHIVHIVEADVEFR